MAAAVSEMAKPPAISLSAELSMFGSVIVTEANGVSVCPEAVVCPATVPDMTGACARNSDVAPAYG